MPIRSPGPSTNDPDENVFDAPRAARWAFGRWCVNVQDRWSKAELLQRARAAGIAGRSTMSKRELVAALRQH